LNKDSWFSSPTLVNSTTMAFGDRDGRLYAIEIDTTHLARSTWPKGRGDLRNTGRPSFLYSNTNTVAISDVSLGQVRSASFAVVSLGNLSAMIDSVTVTNGLFTASSPATTIPPGDSLRVEVTYRAADRLTQRSDIVVWSSLGRVSLVATGSGVTPTIDSPQSLHVQTLPGQALPSTDFSIGNTGIADLLIQSIGSQRGGTVSPTSGVVGPGDILWVSLTYSTIPEDGVDTLTITSDDPDRPNLTIPITLGRDKSSTYVRIHATTEDMASGQYRVSWSVYAEEPGEMGFGLEAYGLDPDSLYTSFSATGGEVTAGVVQQVVYGQPGVTAMLSWDAAGWHEISYTVAAQPAGYGASYLDENVGVIALQVGLPFIDRGPNTTPSPFGAKEMFIEIDVPEGMPVYAPWERTGESDRLYRVENVLEGGTDRRGYDLNIAAWGHFTAVDSASYGDHTFYMVSYQDDAANTFPLMKAGYDYLMQAYIGLDHSVFVSPTHVMVLFPESWDQIDGPRSIGGGYGRNWDGHVWEMTPKVFDGTSHRIIDATTGQSEATWFYFDEGSGKAGHGVNMTHGLLDNRVPTAWCDEGIAHLLKFEIMREAGLMTQHDINRELRGIYETSYLSLIERGDDLSFEVAEVEFYSGGSLRANTILFEKAPLFFHAVDKLIRRGSQGEASLIAGMRRYHQLILEVRNPPRLERFFDPTAFGLMEQAFTEVSGIDFGPFFERYAYGSDPFPFVVSSDTLLVTYNNNHTLLPDSSTARISQTGQSPVDVMLPGNIQMDILLSESVPGRLRLDLTSPVEPQLLQTPLPESTTYLTVTPERSLSEPLRFAVQLPDETDIDSTAIAELIIGPGSAQTWSVLGVGASGEMVEGSLSAGSLIAITSASEPALHNSAPTITGTISPEDFELSEGDSLHLQVPILDSDGGQLHVTWLLNEVVVATDTVDAGIDAQLAALLPSGSHGESTVILRVADTYTIAEASWTFSIAAGVTVLAGDFDGDGSVGFTDFLLFAGAFGSDDTTFDLDNDGQVGFTDFLAFASAFGTSSAKRAD
jgi:hypothetical protein